MTLLSFRKATGYLLGLMHLAASQSKAAISPSHGAPLQRGVLTQAAQITMKEERKFLFTSR